MMNFYRTVLKCLILLLLHVPLVISVVAAQPLGSAVTKITVKAIPGLQYDVVRFKVKPGSKVTLSLENTDDMSHNLLITRPGARLNVVNSALQLAEKGPGVNYIPKSPQVLWAITVVSPGQVKELSFVAPSKTGVYPYVCTFPGHGFVMYGAMYVMESGGLPEMNKDMNIPEGRRKDSAEGGNASHAGHAKLSPSPHPYSLIPPFLYRVFIDGASPAAIAVSLPLELSYCWDAGTCKLRFAWKGGFIDNTDLWKGHADGSAKVLGEIFFRDNLDYPFRIGNSALVPATKFKGYRLVDRYPEFHYTVDGLDVFELIHPAADGYGLVRTFRIPAAKDTVFFYTNHQDDAIEYKSSAGVWKGGRLELSPEQANEVSVMMTSYQIVGQKKKK